ncbi:LptA/OstA family protein [Flammeovirga sp. SJP92]|uniref:LptA/OstA family protein n=1 Tax=Flammeovirga sp. SJP92 TaxID=1775430 RepID=UPI00078762A9|nr:LptA/OstA family protein [Flammeovirga sp. SJP92]KXX68541.1 hypothetical protein AVL50_22525 [Flammeovirga sp. SJP92]
MLKQTSILCLITLVLSLFSCSTEEENIHPIVGKWQLQEFELIQETELIFDDRVTKEDPRRVEYQNINITYDFRNDKTLQVSGTADLVSYDENGEVDYTVTNQATLTDYTWEIEGDNLILQTEVNGTIASGSIKIITMSDNEIIAQSIINREFDWSTNKQVDVITSNYKFIR